MTSSLYVSRRREIKLPPIPDDDGLGGLSNHHIIPGGTHKCHPDFESHPIGLDSPLSWQMCIRKKVELPSTPLPKTPNGYYKSKNLYSLDSDPLTISNPRSVEGRTMPHIKYHMDEDYLRLPMKFDGTGVRPGGRFRKGYRYHHEKVEGCYNKTKYYQNKPVLDR